MFAKRLVCRAKPVPAILCPDGGAKDQMLQQNSISVIQTTEIVAKLGQPVKETGDNPMPCLELCWN
jgi:hypothetical protein